MADPVLAEDHIISLLRSPVEPGNVSRLQAGAVKAIVDLYDRGCSRENFIGMASACIAMYGQAAKYWTVTQMLEADADGKLDRRALYDAEAALIELILAQAKIVEDIVNQLKQCPGTEDRVH